MHDARSASAQTAPAILADGNAVATGFSGVELPATIAPGVDPATKTSVDLEGPVLRVIDLQAPGGPPQAQVLTAPKPFTVTAGQIGQAFGVAIDNALPPNIYVGATSVYGLPIVVPDQDNDGQPDRAQQGAANASFMPGLFGPPAQGGGPGAIWRIDGATGAVSLFANVTLDGVANSGPALGGLAFDPTGNALFVADRETGMIHRFDMAGAETGRYDHGTQGRTAGLPPAPFDPSKRVAITVPAFQPANPSTWGYAPPARRVFGLAVRSGRLYYAVAENLQVWSVAITPDGAFGADARIEVTVPPGQGPSEISKIAFDDQGRMLLAERAAPTGASNFAALTAGGGRVLRYSPVSGGAGPAWQPSPDEYAIGFTSEMRNGNGGVAVGYGYDPAGALDRNACGGALWSTGERLRVASDAALAAQLAQSGSPDVNGLQGNGIDAVRPANAPPLQSYFVDFDDDFDDPDARGRMGDVAVFRNCARPGLGGLPGPGMPGMPPPGEPAYPPEPPPGEPILGPEGGPDGPGPWPDWLFWPWWPDDGPFPPPPLCPPGTHLANGLVCCEGLRVPGPNGQCRSPCANGSTAVDDMTACRAGFQPLGGGLPSGGTCWNGSAPVQVPGPGCAGGTGYACWKCPKPPHATCEGGNTPVAAVVGPPATGSDWSNANCPPPCIIPGTTRGNDGLCHAAAAVCPGGTLASNARPVRMCCLNGTNPDPITGQCQPGLYVPQPWYLTYLATGSNPCPPPYTWCSFYEFTIRGQGAFGRGSLRQRITLPAGSDFPNARITKGSRHCPASAWSCSKAGDVITCSTDNCGLAAGDEVVLRTDGKVAPNQTEAFPTPVEKTACGVLDWEPMAGRGPATIAEPDEFRRAQAFFRRQDTRAGADGAVRPGSASTEACWSIVLLPRRPDTPATTTPPTTSLVSCAPNYVAMADGQCCLARQMTRSGVCCPAGQRPSPDGRTCAPRCPEGRVWTGNACVCPPGTIEMRGRCLVPQPTGPGCPAGYVPSRDGVCCLKSQMTRGGICCPAGQRPNPDGRTCSPRCPEGRVWTGSACACPAGTVEMRGLCVPRGEPTPPPCSGGKVRIDGICRCPEGTYERRGLCAPRREPPPPVRCTGGKVMIDGVCRCPEGTYEKRGLCVPHREPPRPIRCAGGKVLMDGVCRCPEGTYEKRGLCVPHREPPPPIRCTGGKVLMDGACRCPEGTYERRGRCVRREIAPPPITCPEGTIKIGRRCVPRRDRPPPIVCPKGTMKIGDRCVPRRERPPSGPSPQMQQLQPGLLQIRPVPR